MGTLTATVTFDFNYGHPGNRPSADWARKQITAAVERAMEQASNRRLDKPFSTDSELAGWSFTGIKVE